MWLIFMNVWRLSENGVFSVCVFDNCFLLNLWKRKTNTLHVAPAWLKATLWQLSMYAKYVLEFFQNLHLEIPFGEDVILIPHWKCNNLE